MKILTRLAVVALALSAAGVRAQSISDFPPASVANPTDLIPTTQGYQGPGTGVTRKVTTHQIINTMQASDVTRALTYTPYNITNPSGFITHAALPSIPSACLLGGTGTTLAGVTVSTGLSCGGNSLSVQYGSAAGTAAAGNDARILGALQGANNLSDVGNATTARINLGLGGASVLNVGTTAGTVAAGNDTRILGALQTSAAGPLATQAGASPSAAVVGALGFTPPQIGTATGTARDAAAAITAETAAQNAANSAQTTANAAIPTAHLGQPSGPAALDASGTISANLTAATNALNARTQAAMAADRINALSQNVAADGITDNSLTLPAACVVAASAGKALYLPAGVYIADGANLSACPMVVGDGPGRTIIRRKPSATHNFTVEWQNVSGFSVRDLTIDGNQTHETVSGFGVILSGDWNFDLQNVDPINSSADGLFITNNQDAANGTGSELSRVYSSGNGGVGIHLQIVKNLSIVQSGGNSNTGNGFLADFGSMAPPLAWVGANKSILLAGFQALGNGKSGIDIPGMAGPATTAATTVLGNHACTSEGVQIDNADAENNAGYGLVAQGCGMTVQGGLFKANGVKVNGFFGGFFAGVLANAENSVFSGIVSDGNEYYGMDAGGCYACKVTSNVFLNNGNDSLSSGGIGLNLGAARYVDADDNVFLNNGFTPGGIAQLTITPGSGYTAPTITASGGSGSGASLTATEAGGVITSVFVNAGGTLWLDPIVTSAGGGCTTQPTYQATLEAGVITNVSVLTGGSGCTSAPTVTAQDGTGFAATLQVTGGQITGYTITNPGQGYVNAPTLVISDATGTGSTATATIGQGTEIMAHRVDGSGGTTVNGALIAFGWDASHLRIRHNRFTVPSLSYGCVKVVGDIQFVDLEENQCSNAQEQSGSLWANAFWIESTVATVHNNYTDQTYPYDQHYHQSGGNTMTVPDWYERVTLTSAGTSLQNVETNFISTYLNAVYAVKMVNRGTAPYTKPQAVATGGACTTEPTLTAFVDGAGFIANIDVASPGVGCTTAPTVTISDTTGTGAGATATAFIAPWNAIIGRKLDIDVQTGPVTFLSSGSHLKLNSPYVAAVNDTLVLQGWANQEIREVSRSQPNWTNATPATPTACGTTPAIGTGSTNQRGTITIGSGTVTACTVAFGSAAAETPTCTVSTNNASVSAAVAAVATTGFTLGFSASLGGGQVSYVCAQ